MNVNIKKMIQSAANCFLIITPHRPFALIILPAKVWGKSSQSEIQLLIRDRFLCNQYQ